MFVESLRGVHPLPTWQSLNIIISHAVNGRNPPLCRCTRGDIWKPYETWDIAWCHHVWQDPFSSSIHLPWQFDYQMTYKVSFKAPKNAKIEVSNLPTQIGMEMVISNWWNSKHQQVLRSPVSPSVSANRGLKNTLILPIKSPKLITDPRKSADFQYN